MLSATRAEEGSMEWVYSDGRRTEVPSIDRGRMLVHSEDEWLDRFKQRGILPALQYFVIFFFFTAIAPPFEWPFQLLIAPVLGGIALVAAYYLVILRHIRTGRPLPGIYERGVEQWDLESGYKKTFLPFSEVERTRWWGSLGKTAITLHLRNSPNKVTLQEAFYGVDGLRFVDDVVNGRVRTAETAPRLVVYGPHRGI